MTKLLALLLFISAAGFEKNKPSKKLCVFLKKTNEYNSYIKRMEKVFLDTLDRSLYEPEVFYHESNIESIKQVSEKISKNSCQYIWGGVSSTDSIMLLKLLDNKDKILISPTSSSIELSKLQNKTVYMTPNDIEVAEFLFSKLKNNKKPIIVVQNLSYPNTNVIASHLFNLLHNNKNKVIKIKIFKHSKRLQLPKIDGHYSVVVPSYESDLNKVFQSIKNIKGITFYGIDAWGTNESVFQKFALNNKDFLAIRVGYWNHNTCEIKKFKPICDHFYNVFKKRFDSFMAIAHDSALLLNYLANASLPEKYMAYQPLSLRNRGHFYQISTNGVSYMESK